MFPDNHLQKGSAQCILLYHNTLPNTLDYSLWWNLLVSLASNNPFHLFGHCKGTFLWLKIICVTWLYLFSKHLLWPWQYSYIVSSIKCGKTIKNMVRIDVKKGWIEKKENQREIMSLYRYSKRYLCKMSIREPGLEFCSTIQWHSYIRK